MKVVLFCGGFGMRIRGNAISTPKPLITIGGRPILWHIMRYYAHFGHNEFILCLGYKADVIRSHFLGAYASSGSDNGYDTLSTDLSNGPMTRDIGDWRVSFVDTGLDTIIGQRLKAVEALIGDDETFLVNYSDGLTDLHLPDLISRFVEGRKLGVFLSVRPRSNSFHEVQADESGNVLSIQPINQANIWMNGGYFVFNRKIFEYIESNEDLVNEPLQRLISENQLATMRHDGFWASMDTFKDREILEDMVANGPAPWEVWKSSQRRGPLRAGPDRVMPSKPVAVKPGARRTKRA